ncbi:glucose 1-dehydrogenase [Massilia arenosa]|uniref:Glucose 1-dehydrogenase n=1 Tax=Zemynaea arenosa TaxID=2561931 RepID=A0A4Y9SU42_9BURK|nr:glucose 1-dehydrogenase [Massilia arenosa]TFW28849.1 glucose 1-dehydrogenase [Massilia arenosa]
MKTILITGGGRGIGAACARLAAQRGYAVAINYQSNRAAADAVAAEIRAAGGRAITIAADVSDETAVERMFARVDEEFGHLDALVNNAGIVDRAARVEDMTAARIDRMMRVNVTGAFLCAREAVRRMSKARGGQGGAIVNISSKAALLGSPNSYVDYAASKAAVETLTIGLAAETARDGIRVNALRPGLIDTEIHAVMGIPDRVARMGPSIPMGRAGTPEEVAQGVLWLLSDEAAYVTGTFLDVTGGR